MNHKPGEDQDTWREMPLRPWRLTGHLTGTREGAQAVWEAKVVVKS